MRNESNLFADLHRLFLDNACLHPRRYCISAKQSDHTYKEVGRRSSQLSKLLCENLPVRKKNTVAVLLSELESLSLMVVAFLKTDAKFLFIDSRIAQEEIRQIIKN